MTNNVKIMTVWVWFGRVSSLTWLWITLPIAAGCCHYCDEHAKLVAKLDFVSVFGLNYIAVLYAGVETIVRILMVNSCNSVGTRSRVSNFCRVRSGHGWIWQTWFCSFCTFYCCFWGDIMPLLNLLDSVYSVLFTSLLRASKQRRRVVYSPRF